MKLLSLLQGHRAEDQTGFHHSGARLVEEGFLQEYRAIPFLSADQQPPKNPVYDLIQKTVQEMKPDFVFFQHFHFYRLPDPTLLIEALRRIVPQAVLFVSSGDSFGRWTRALPQSLVQASRACDITFLSGMGYVADDLAKRGGKRIALMPHGFCPVRFPPVLGSQTTVRSEWDVVCVASNYQVKNPFSYLYRHKLARIREIQGLSRRYGKKFALFGRGWKGFKGWQGPLPFEKQGEIFRASRVVVGGHPGGSMDYYLSDREFIAMASGSPFVEFWTPRIEKLLRAEEHWHLYRSEGEMIQVVDRLLGAGQNSARQQAAETERYIRARHSHYHRLKEMLEISKKYRKAQERKQGYQPQLSMFLPEVDWEKEKGFALRRWD